MYIPQKTETIRDVNCDSKFMITSINDIGFSIRTAYSFLPKTQTIYLFMDNAGGHGKQDVKDQYVEKLKKNTMLKSYGKSHTLQRLIC